MADPLDPLVRRILAAVPIVPRPVVLVDGRSGSGKSTLAERLAGPLGAQLLRLDDVYPGWDGLEAAAEQLRTDVLGSPSPHWRVWDWAADAPGERHEVDGGRPLVVEGAGALSRATRRSADLALWVDLDDDARRRRALARDGATYAPHWDRWAAQEAAFIARERPRELADLVVDAATWTIAADRSAGAQRPDR